MITVPDNRLQPRSRLAAIRAARLREVRDTFRAVSWQSVYRRRLLLTDAGVVVGTAVVAALFRGRVTADSLTSSVLGDQILLALALSVAWLCGLGLARSYDVRVFASGPSEYQRVFDASWRLVTPLALFALIVSAWPGLRTFLLVAVPLGVVALLAGRWANRTWLHRQRLRGHAVTQVLAVGLRDQVERLISELNSRPSGYRVVGVCVPASGGARPGEEVLGVPVLGDLTTAGAMAAAVGADCVAVSGSDCITADVVRRLGWELEPAGVDLMLTAELADVAGPRITVTPEQSVSLLHVDAPRFTGPRYVLKSVADWIGAALITVLTLPVMIPVALAVALTSRGGVLFRQDRVGRDGRTFKMLKFRSMRVGADRDARLLGGESDGAGVLFKLREDPRVTRVGKVIRRYSLDELPQLFNVLAGQMSLVGPRPPLPQEVSRYEARMRRRLRVKPGITGLWQVGGRSSLSWEETVRLDVYYAENWTLFGDFLILVRTAKAVLSARGAY
ncbi:sugar transferase [Isoptericola sp. NEAU-Y5]|uniref:Sugar transferase n=1 Tax=Isoptericola luteus TaxID=2879484 RepID=A0ABS7ZD93_9MICO|nr:sugar transferase [Isoptericola sp. NEAU-Y5]MCA5893010.1 sugar transferase [Isoptericola sp. NEAU-Y5]